MAFPWAQVLIPVGVAILVPFAFYILFLGLGATPFFQRHFLYAHKINTLWWRGINEPERFGFANGQVTPFFLDTPDGESVYIWHIAPLPLYLQHEDQLSSQPPGVASDITSSETFKLLKQDPEAKVIITLHGNAGDIAQGHRPDNYHALTDTSSYHVFAIDYRGYGHSTGTPTEDGLILDARTLIDFVMNKGGVSPDRIVILGQSLGTAVACGAAEWYVTQGVEFAGIVLVAGFSTLPRMLSGYRAGGVVPVFGPMTRLPGMVRLFERFIRDTWHSKDRLHHVIGRTRKRMRLTIIAAKDDPDIPCTESDKLFKAAAKALRDHTVASHESFDEWKDDLTIRKRNGAFVSTVEASPNIIIRQELYPYGGHNNILSYAPVVLAIMRSFDLSTTVGGEGSDGSGRYRD